VCKSWTYSKSQSSGGEAQVETQAFRLAAEGSEAETFEHLQIFPILGERRSSGGGATSAIRSAAGRDLDHSIYVQTSEGAHRGGEQIPAIGSEREGSTSVGSR
jgi:hypothetical protein